MSSPKPMRPTPPSLSTQTHVVMPRTLKRAALDRVEELGMQDYSEYIRHLIREDVKHANVKVFRGRPLTPEELKAIEGAKAGEVVRMPRGFQL